MKIYTKTGDDGTTGLSGGSRRAKSDLRFHAIGDVDELNAALGLSACQASPEISEVIETIQSRLFDLGSELSCVPGDRIQFELLKEADVAWLERNIDEFTSDLEPLKNFILPGGSELSARLHLARTICRRAERQCIELGTREALRPVITVYLNRLSDFLFVLARTANASSNVKDIKWGPSHDHSSTPS